MWKGRLCFRFVAAEDIYDKSCVRAMRTAMARRAPTSGPRKAAASSAVAKTAEPKIFDANNSGRQRALRLLDFVGE
jgi:hypothetical protein